MPAPRITAAEFGKRLTQEPITILDVRQGDPYSESLVKIKGSIRIDPNSDQEIQSFIDATPKSQPVMTYCT